MSGDGVSLLSRAGGAARHLLTLWALVSLVGTGVIAMKADELREIVQHGKPCASFPGNGHMIEGAKPGEFGQVTWTVTKLRECGRVQLRAVIINGGGIWHDAPLSFQGVPLSTGTHEIQYKFRIPSEVRPGLGRFFVTVTYPDAPGGAPATQSPQLPFNIERNTL